MRHLAAGATAVLVVALTGCTGSTTGSQPGASPSSSATESSSEPPTEPSGGPSATGESAALDWKPVPGPTGAEATVSGDWTLTVAPSGEVTLTGPRDVAVDVPRDFEVTDALVDGEYAVVVAEHERAQQPNLATVVELATGETATIDGDSRIPTTVGGTWALGSGLLVHATTSGGDYCLAFADLTTGRSEPGPCVPPRHGVTNANVSPAGTTVMTFDDGRPSCRTLNRVEGRELVALAGVEECRGWEAVSTETFAVWGVVERERRIEESRFWVDGGDGPVDLGPGTTGTLTWCGEAAYFVRDPQRDSDPARLLRVRPDGATEVVYESPGRGNAFLSAPRCGGTDLTVSAFSAAGDEQVTAEVG